MTRALLFVVCAFPAACRSLHDPRALALLDADRHFAADTRARRLEGWMEAFDAHGSQVDESFQPITGAAAIRAHMQGFFADPTLHLAWEPESACVSEAGNLGSVTGRFRMFQTAADGSEITLATGRYFDVWRRQADGTWKVLYDVGDEDRR